MSFLLPPLPPNFRAALRDVKGKRPESRMAAAERLGHADGSEREPAIAGLSELARDPHAGVRATAIAALGVLGAEAQVQLVLDALADPFPEVREIAAMAAAQIGGEAALSGLRKALGHAAAEVRFQAVAAVAELDPTHAARDLIPLLSDADAEVRAQAVRALASLEEAHLNGHLAGALEDVSPEVRLEAALALAGTGDARGEAVLLQALAQRERVLEIAPALAELHSQRAREPLAKIALSFLAAPALRAAAAAALARLDDERGIHALQRVLRSLRSDARNYAVELARDLKSEALADDLARLAARPRGTDLLTLAGTLAEYAAFSEVARAALKKLAAREDEIGQAARRAVSRSLGPSKDPPPT